MNLIERTLAMWRGTLLASVPAAAVLLWASCASALTVSPLNGTPDAAPGTQISFLGLRPSQIWGVAAVGSRSGPHAGRLEAYASAPGASFLPAKPFTPGERVAVRAVVGPGRRHISWTFAVARQLPNPATASAASLAPKPGTVMTFASAPGFEPPSLQVTVDSPAAAPGYVFLTPNHGYGESGPMIVDDTGQPVWFQPEPRGTIAMDLQVQEYEGRPALVWWQGHITDGVGFGTDEIYSSSYQPLAQVTAGNGYAADLHAVRLTPEGSAYVTAYSFVHADLSSVGGSRYGILQDALLQEVDIKTGLVMFEWHAYGHVPLSDSYYRPGQVTQPWDYFHINSISPDPWPDGNFIVSARNTWTAYEINHHTGAILWQIGGKRSSFRMGPGTGTAWQHDVRWQPDHTLTIFDNGAVPKAHAQSRVIRERIDWAKRTVVLVDRDVHTPALLSGSQGDDQLLPNGDSFVGWGEMPYVTEYSSTGQVLFDAHLSAPGQSYRAYRFPWTGTPTWPPALAVRSAGPGTVTVYASWNGATGVTSWRILGGDSPAALRPIARTARSGFETAISLHTSRTWFAAQAIGSDSQVLATSAAANG